MIQVPDRFTADEVAEESARERYLDGDENDIALLDGGSHFDDLEDDYDDLRDQDGDW